MRSRKKDNEAKSIYQRILQQYPNNPIAAGARLHNSRYNVLSLIESGNDTAIQLEIDKIKTDLPNHPELPWFFRCIVNKYEDSKKYQAAKNIYLQILQQFPDTVLLPGTKVGFANYAKLQMARFNICSLADSGNIDGMNAAIEKMKSDFAANPMLPEAIFRAIEPVYEKESSRTESPFFKRAIELIENDILGKTANINLETDAYYMLALNYQQLGDYLKAVQAFENAYLDNPKHHYADYFVVMQGYCYEQLFKTGKITEAEAKQQIKAAYTKLVTEYPSSVSVPRVQKWLEDNK